MRRSDSEDARVWASSIGSDTVDIRDRRAANTTAPPMRG